MASNAPDPDEIIDPRDMQHPIFQSDANGISMYIVALCIVAVLVIAIVWIA